jgi:hypothetical protein
MGVLKPPSVKLRVKAGCLLMGKALPLAEVKVNKTFQGIDLELKWRG